MTGLTRSRKGQQAWAGSCPSMPTREGLGGWGSRAGPSCAGAPPIPGQSHSHLRFLLDFREMRPWHAHVEPRLVPAGTTIWASAEGTPCLCVGGAAGVCLQRLLKTPPRCSPHQAPHCPGRSSRRRSGAGTRRGRWGRCRKPAGSHSRGARPESGEPAQGRTGLGAWPSLPSSCPLCPGMAACRQGLEADRRLPANAKAPL